MQTVVLADVQVAQGSAHRMQAPEASEAGGAQAVQFVAITEQFVQVGAHLAQIPEELRKNPGAHSEQDEEVQVRHPGGHL